MPVLPGGVFTIAALGTVTASGGQSRNFVSIASYEHTAGSFHAGWPGALIAAYEATVWSGVAVLLHTDYSAGSYLLYSDPFVLPPPDFTFAMGVSGGIGGGREPVSACVNLLPRTAFRGKSFRSVRRLGPIPSASVAGDELTAAALASWQAAAANYLLPLSLPFGDVFSPRLLSRQLSSQGPPAVWVGAPLTAVLVNKTIGLARHRRERTVR